MKKQVILVAARSLQHFLNEIPFRFKQGDNFSVYRTGRVETEFYSFRYVRKPEDLRGYHGIKFEVWGPPVNWVQEKEGLDEIKMAERP